MENPKKKFQLLSTFFKNNFNANAKGTRNSSRLSAPAFTITLVYYFAHCLFYGLSLLPKRLEFEIISS